MTITHQDFVDFQERNFIVFCKHTIDNCSAYAKRTSINSIRRNETLMDCILQEQSYATVVDDYQTYTRCFDVRGIPLVVRDEAMGECLQYIPPNKRSVLLLSYFADFSDTEIAKHLGITNAAVHYRKKDALKRLRAMMEAMNHEG